MYRVDSGPAHHVPQNRRLGCVPDPNHTVEYEGFVDPTTWGQRVLFDQIGTA